MGAGDLKWNTNRLEGVYSGQRVHDHNAPYSIQTRSNSSSYDDEDAYSNRRPLQDRQTNRQKSDIGVENDSRYARYDTNRQTDGSGNSQSLRSLYTDRMMEGKRNEPLPGSVREALRFRASIDRESRGYAPSGNTALRGSSLLPSQQDYYYEPRESVISLSNRQASAEHIIAERSSARQEKEKTHNRIFPVDDEADVPPRRAFTQQYSSSKLF